GRSSACHQGAGHRLTAEVEARLAPGRPRCRNDSGSRRDNMMIAGRLRKDGTWWLAESEIADVCTQGRSRKAAAQMLEDAFETLLDRPGCKVTVTDAGRADGE